MPNYEYKCPLCEAKKTITRSIHEDDPGYKCDNCKIAMIHVLGIVSVTFKGGGWAHKE